MARIKAGFPQKEDLSEKKIVDNRALLCLKLDPVQDNAAGFRTWRNALLVQIAKLDKSGENLVHRWLSEAFQLDREDLEESGLLLRLDVFIAGEMSSLQQIPDLEHEVTAYVERRTLRPARYSSKRPVHVSPPHQVLRFG